MTYTILARDPQTGELAAAVATRWPAVGAVVPWVEPGVGVVATQAFTNIELGPHGLVAMRRGLPALAALTEVLAHESQPGDRQLGLLDAAGNSAGHTGSSCVREAGHIAQRNVIVLGNMLASQDVLPQMVEAFRDASGDVAERSLAALRAGDRAGGDVRGHGSAALLVAPGGTDASAIDRRFDLRVDAAAAPLEELARLLELGRAYEALEAAIDAAGREDLAAALAATGAARQLAPDDTQVAFWHALALAASGRLDEARPVYARAIHEQPSLSAFGSRLMSAGRAGGLVRALGSLGEPD